jgi:hypothetical protein
MIEVEGMINNHAFTILIDLGASHSYIDPKLVERFLFPRSKHGKILDGTTGYRSQEDSC